MSADGSTLFVGDGGSSLARIDTGTLQRSWGAGRCPAT